MSVNLPPSIQEIRDKAKIKWRSFSTDENGVCDETPDEVWDEGFDACYSHMLAQAREGFNEKAAKEFANKPCDHYVSEPFVEGAHWQHDQTALHIRELEENLKLAIEALKYYGKNYNTNSEEFRRTLLDKGEKARSALAILRPEEDKT